MGIRLLAIETSGPGGEVALMENGRALCSHTIPGPRRHAELLVPAIQQVLNEADWSLADLEFVAVGIGPGSYTGLRVGVTCAKTLAYAADLNVIGTGTLEAIALNAPSDADVVAVVSDAQRGQVYAAIFRRAASAALPLAGRRDPSEGQGRGLLEAVGICPAILNAEKWAESLPAGCFVIGPGLDRYRKLVPASCDVGAQESWRPCAEAVGRLAWFDYRSGRRDDLYQLQPLYLRKSAAEEKWERVHGSGGQT